MIPTKDGLINPLQNCLHAFTLLPYSVFLYFFSETPKGQRQGYPNIVGTDAKWGVDTEANEEEKPSLMKDILL